MKRRDFGLSLISLLLMTQAPAFAQEKKEVCLVVPFPPGGGGDNLARSEVEYLSKNLGSTVWIANRPGAGGNIGTSSVVQAAPDGKTFGYVTNGIFCVNPLLYKTTNFDPMKDLIPVGQLSKIGLIMVLNPKAIPGVTDLPSLIKYAKEHPGEVNFASSGVGTTSHLAGQYFAQVTGRSISRPNSFYDRREQQRPSSYPQRSLKSPCRYDAGAPLGCTGSSNDERGRCRRI